MRGIPKHLSNFADIENVLASFGIVAFCETIDKCRGGYEGLGFSSEAAFNAVFCEEVTGALEGDAYTILRPKIQNNNTMVLVTHGAGATQANVLTDYGAKYYILDLVAAGFTVVSGLYGGTQTWGVQSSIDKMAALSNYAISEYSLTKSIVLSVSMGALTGLNGIDQGVVDNLLGWVGIAPATNLAWCYANGFTSAINTAYGIPGSGSYESRTVGHDPNLFSSIAVPMRICASYADLAVYRSTNADLILPKALSGTIRDHTGTHGDLTAWPNVGLLEFCLGLI